MNHLKGEESTSVGEPCSSRTNCPQSSVLRQAKPRQTAVLRPGRTFRKGRTLCGGFRPFLLLGKRESRSTILVGRAERDPADGAHRDDQLLTADDGQREEAVAGLAREGLQCEPLPVAKLDLDVGALRTVRGRVPLDLAMDARDEVVERRFRCPRDPELRAQKSFASSAFDAPTCSRPSCVTIRPRGVRCRNPSWSRYGS